MSTRKLTSDQHYHLIQLMEIVRDPRTAPDDMLRCAGDALDYLDPDVVAKSARKQFPEIVAFLLSHIRNPGTSEAVKDEYSESILEMVCMLLTLLDGNEP
jgi:hypothetical protein